MTLAPLTWDELESFDAFQLDRVNGPTNSQSCLRLFGHDESEVRVTLFRDHHAWCPYCQKIWLWLEEMKIPYRIQKVTMFCYGEKERWYKRKVPSGMLPAVELEGHLITESDDILIALESVFGVLEAGMNEPKMVSLRKLERLLFRAWCSWLCYPTRSPRQDWQNRQQFQAVMADVEIALSQTPDPYFLADFSTADVIFTPYVERMNASLFYYKGYSMRSEHPQFAVWCDGMEARSTYRGTQSDFHTHAHDLPPQMGGCWANSDPQTAINQRAVDHGPWIGLPDVRYAEPENSRIEALHRVLKHRHTLISVNPEESERFDQALRCALTRLIKQEPCKPPAGSEVALRYLRDRISVPRDMSIYAAKRLREALEATAAMNSDRQGPDIPFRHRRDQDPSPFLAV